MSERERLKELFQQAEAKCDGMKQCEGCVGSGEGSDCVDYLIIDHLLANGVIVPPCKVEDKLYYITPVKTIEECIVHAVECEENKITVKCHLWRKEHEALLHKHFVYFNITDFGKTVFLTREEAERALEGKT